MAHPFFEKDLVRSLREKFRERIERFVDQDNIALILVHEGIHGMIGVVVIDEEACNDEIDFGRSSSSRRLANEVKV